MFTGRFMKRWRDSRFMGSKGEEGMKVKRIDDILAKVSGEIAIYGAGVVAYNIAEALREIYRLNCRRFFVSEAANTSGFGGIRAEVFSKERFREWGSPLILVATPPVYHEAIVEKLCENGVEEYCLVDPDAEYSLMGEFYRRKRGFSTVESLPGYPRENFRERNLSERKRVEVYMAVSAWDKPLKERYEMPPWIIPVQAGRKLAKEGLLDRGDLMRTDDFEGGISGKNGNYFELTVTYWAWKERRADYKGLCHYRRVFDLSESDLDKIKRNDVDALLPLPYLCRPDAGEQYFRYVSKEDFEAFLRAVSKVYPKRRDEIHGILKEELLYNYNMVIAKEHIFDEYCEFMFSILFEVEEDFKRQGMVRNDRYLAYLGELLTSVYFTMQGRERKIVHGKKIWLV